MSSRPARRLQALASALTATPAPASATELTKPALLITDIKCYLEPFFMVKVETNQGTYGWGESGIGRDRGLAVQVGCCPSLPHSPAERAGVFSVPHPAISDTCLTTAAMVAGLIAGCCGALPELPAREGRDGHRRALAGNVSLTVLRGGACADRGSVGHRPRPVSYKTLRHDLFCSVLLWFPYF